MTEEDTRSLPGAAQAALRNRAVRAVLDGMTQAEAARVLRVHHNAVNRWVKRYREGGFQGLPSSVAVAVQGSRRPSPNGSSRNSSR
jgi:transposase